MTRTAANPPSAQRVIDSTREVPIVAHPWICCPDRGVEILLDASQYTEQRARDKRLFRCFDAQILDLLVQRVAIDSKEIGGLRLHAVAAGERAVDQRGLDLIDDELIDLAFALLVVADRLLG